LNSDGDQNHPQDFFVKVHGHSGDQHHEEAERLAVEGAYEESDDEGTLFPGGRGQFLAGLNAARPQLGVALRFIWDWAVRAWMLSLTPGQSPVKSNLKKWGQTATAQCDRGHGDETFLHQQLHCHLTHRRNMKQTVYNNVAKVIENQVQHINPETRHAQWDRKVLTFLTHSANANTLKVSNHSTWSPKRKLDELLKPFGNITSSQRLEGLIEDTKLKHIYIIEVARTGDSPDSLLRSHVKKMCSIIHCFMHSEWHSRNTW